MTEQEDSILRQQAYKKAVRELARLRLLQDEVQSREYIDGDHLRDCMRAYTAEAHDVLLMLYTHIMTAALGKQGEAFCQQSLVCLQSLEVAAELDVVKHGYTSELVTRHHQSFTSAIAWVAGAAQHELETEAIALCKLYISALPLAIQGALVVTVLAYHVFNCGPLWHMNAKSTHRDPP